MTSGAWFGSITPPEPMRMVDVAAPTALSSTAGAEDVIPGIPWCSATQMRS